MDATVLVRNAPWIFALAIVGVLGCLILLAVGLNMLARERGQTPAAGQGPRWPAFLGRRLTPPPDPAPAGAPAEVLRVLRHPLTGRLIVEIAGRRYHSLAEITDADAAQGLQVTVRDLAQFAGAEPAAAATAAPAAPPPQAAPPAQPSARPALRVPSMNPFRQVLVLRELGTLEPPPPVSLAQQIDEVLQQLIAGTPFAARQLQVRTGPEDGVLFAADGAAHTELADIPDPAVQEVFREAIRRWESR